MNFEFLNKLWIKIALAVTLLVVLLLGLFNYLLLNVGQQAFVQVLNVAPADELIYFEPTQWTGGGGVISAGSVSTAPVSGFQLSPAGFEPLSLRFRDRFQNAVVWVFVFGILGSIAIGLMVSRFVVNPLQKLNNGMRNLRQNKYSVELKPTGEQEFDDVITEFNSVVKELKRVEDLRKDLISDTSHELRTPITSLRGQLEGMRDGVLKADKKRIDSLLTQVQRLDELSEQLQEFSRVRSKSGKLAKRKVVLSKLLDEVIADFKLVLQKEGIEIESIVPKGFALEADPELLRRLFTNLIENTLRYARAKKISIVALDRNLSYRDDGVGVPTKDLPYLFERFYRVEKSRNRETGGLGLGLAIVKEIVDVHGWEIEVRNERGLVFEVRV